MNKNTAKKSHSKNLEANILRVQPRPNQKFLDDAKKEREEIFEKMKNISDYDENGFISTQQLANILYPNAPTYDGGFTSKKKYTINVYGDSLLSKLKIMERDGLVESVKSKGRRLWKIKQT